MFEKKKKNYAQGEMRPLFALMKKETEKNVYARKTVPPQQPVKNFIVDSEDGPKIYASCYNQKLTIAHEPASISEPISEPQPAANSEFQHHKMEEAQLHIPIATAKPESAIQLKPETVPEFRNEPELKSEPVHYEEPLIPEGIFERDTTQETLKSIKPVPEKKTVKATVTRRRRANVPNLSDKDARDVFFAQYVSSNRSKIQDIVDDTPKYISRSEGNPFHKKRFDRPVISHLKEEPVTAAEPESIPVSEKITVKDEVRPGMAEAIENAAKTVRLERKQINAVLDDSNRKDSVQLGAKIRTVGLMVMLMGCSLFLILGERSTFSAEENRKLAEMPEFSMSSYLKGEYTKGVSSYYNDTVPLRSKFKRAIASMENLRGLPSDEEEKIEFFGNVTLKGPDADSSYDEPIISTTTTSVITETAVPDGVKDETTVVTETHTESEIEPDDDEPIEEDIKVGDSIIISNKRAISLYGGWSGTAERYANVLNDYKKQLPDVNVYSLIAPTAVSYYLPEKYKDYTYSEEDNINHANSFFNGVIPVDAYTVLAQHTKEAIYARTDHHWLPLGAYYAAKEFARTADVPFTNLADMDSDSKDDYVGSMYTFTSSTILSENPEKFTYYMPKNKYTAEYYDGYFNFKNEGELFMDIDMYDPVNYYLVFMGGDDKIVHIESDIDNDRTLVIFKDSYGNAMVPCLVGSFSDIYVCDIRYFYKNAVSFCEEVDATDLLFAMNTFSATGSNVKYIENIIYYQ